MSSTVPSDSSVYYSGKYWNDYEVVVEYINNRATGNPQVDWIEFCIEAGYTGRALILNCGNGWVERDLIDRGMVTSCLALDYSESLILEAQEKSGNRDIVYFSQDINSFDFPISEFDLIINYAALHHTAYLNRTLDGCRKALKDGGVLISFDYIGPHRNQYDFQTWEKIQKVNNELPQSAKSELIYPHLPTMLVSDPTEAVHSELFLDLLARHFENVVEKPLGGSIAYPILTHNPKIASLSSFEQKLIIENILLIDSNESNTIDNSLFGFFISKPKVSNLAQSILWSELQAIENLRESRAKQKSGIYYEKSLVQTMTEEISDLRITVEHKQAYIEELFGQMKPIQKIKAQSRLKHLYQRIIKHKFGF
jgi:SAM-dependent methyltransferase